MRLFLTITGISAIVLAFVGFILIWNNVTECKKTNEGFRPHQVYHHHKSKKYIYNHNNACQCISVDDDLKRDSRNWVVFSDGETRYE